MGPWRPDGYGIVTDGRDGVYPRAHRVIYEHYVGPIPDGLVLDHLCRNPSCVNPAHLEPVTVQTNITRGWEAVYDGMCKNKLHPLGGPDSYIWIGKGLRRKRRCRLCHQAARARIRQRVRQRMTAA